MSSMFYVYDSDAFWFTFRIYMCTLFQYTYVLHDHLGLFLTGKGVDAQTHRCGQCLDIPQKGGQPTWAGMIFTLPETNSQSPWK